MDNEGNQKPNKFARGVEESMRPDRPDFGVEAKGSEGGAGAERASSGMPTGDYRGTERANDKKYAAQDLGQAERNASQAGMPGQNDGSEKSGSTGLDTVKSGENKPQQDFKYTGSGKEAPQQTGKQRMQAIMKKKGPIAAVCMTLIAFLLVMAFTAGSSEIINWKENIYSMFGQNSAIINKRSNFMMKRLIRTHKGVKSTLFGGKTKFTISGKLADKLEAEGIKYVEVEGEGGKKVKALISEDVDGNGRLVVADADDVGLLKGVAEVDVGDGKKMPVRGEPMTLLEARASDKAFRVSYDNATLTITGKVAGWFDNVVESLLDRIAPDGTRDRTRDFDGDSDDEVKEKMAKNQAEGSENSKVKKEVPDEDDDESDGTGGDTDTDTDTEPEIEVVEPDDGVEVGSDANVPSATKKLLATAAAFGMGANVVCGFVQAMGAINNTIGAIMRTNSIQYALLLLEVADKIKAGDATDATNSVMRQVNQSVVSKGYDKTKEGEDKMVDLTGSIADSDGFNAPMSSTPIIDEDDPGAMMANYEAPMKIAMEMMFPGSPIAGFLGGLAEWGGGKDAFAVCTGVQLATSGIGVALDVVSFIPGVGQAFKVGKKLTMEVVKDAAFSAMMAAVGIVVSLVAPMFAQWLGASLANLVFGIVGGFVSFSGAHETMAENTQQSTGVHAGKEMATQMALMTQQVETEWAQHERDTLSPFDTSSIYTFLGSIQNSLLPIVNQSGKGVTSVVSSIADLTGSSALAIASPMASAVEKGANLSFGSDANCRYLSSVGVAGDAMCNKYTGAFVDDLDTVDPDDIFNEMVSYGSFSTDEDGEIERYSDGNPKVKLDSDYGKFIAACVIDNAQPGTMSAAVQGFLEKVKEAVTGGNVIVGGIIDFVVGFIPGSDFLDGYDAVEHAANAGWNSKKNCTGNTGDTVLDRKIRVFSSYNLDQRVLEDMGMIEENSSVAMMEEYYKIEPLDRSVEGVLARFSGMTKEQVTDTLAFMEYVNFIANYDPGERYAFGQDQMKIDKPILIENESVTQMAEEKSVLVILANTITFADVRNRTTLV